jgi:TolA-binding protein
MAAVPLNGPQGIIGTLNCYRNPPQSFSAEDVALLETVASYAAVAIHNAYLIDQLNASVTRLREMNQVIQQQHEILARSEDIHQRLTALVLAERGLTAIGETLAVLLGCGVCLYNQHLEAIVSAAAPQPEAPGPVALDPALFSAEQPRRSSHMR